MNLHSFPVAQRLVVWLRDQFVPASALAATTAPAVPSSLLRGTSQRAVSAVGASAFPRVARSRVQPPARAGSIGSRIPAVTRRSPCKVAVQPRVHADPIDPRRVMISGSFKQVCAALDQLIAQEERAATA